MVEAGLITGFKIKLEEIPGASELSCLWKLWLSAFCIGFLNHEFYFKYSTKVRSRRVSVPQTVWNMKAEAGDRWAVLWPGLCEPSLFACTIPGVCAAHHGVL